jgi:hypothetical protein
MKLQKLDLRKKNKGIKADVDDDYSVPDTKVKIKGNNKIEKELNLKLHHKKRYRKLFLFINFISLVIIFSLGYLLYYFVYSPLNNINKSINRIVDTNTLIFEDLGKKDIRHIDSYVEDINQEISYIDSQLDRYAFLKNYKATKGYYENMILIQSILDQSQNLFEKTVPKLKNALETSGFVVSDEQKIAHDLEEHSAVNLIIQELPLYIDLYEDVEPDIYKILENIKRLDPQFLPSVGGFEPDKDWKEVLDFVETYPELSEQLKNFSNSIPSLIGGDKKIQYLLILQNETEMRASGGLITAFGILDIENGQIAEDGIDLQDSWNLQYYLWGLGISMPLNNIYGQAYLMNQGCGATEARAQDVAQYPDLYKTMKDFGLYYDIANKYNPIDFPDYDHYLMINHHFTKEMLKLVEPIQVEVNGVLMDVTSENFFDIVKLETDDSSRAFDRERKSILGDIAEAAKEKFLDLSIENFPLIAKNIVKLFQSKDIAIASRDDDIQTYLDEYGLSGRVAYEFDGDYFHFNEAQNCSLKINRWLRNTVTHNIYINDEGSINHEVLVKWYQPKIWTQELSKQYDATLRFRYRAWTRVFMPPGANILENDGYWASVPYYYWPKEYYDEFMNKYVADNVVSFDHRRFSEADPVEKQTLTVKYTLPESLNYNLTGGYTLLLQKHPGKSWEDGTYEKHILNIFFKGDEYNVEVELDRDKVIEFKEGVTSVRNYDASLDWIIGLIENLPLESQNE